MQTVPVARVGAAGAAGSDATPSAGTTAVTAGAGAGAGAGGDSARAGASGAGDAICATSDAASALGIAAAPLDTMPSLELSESVQLLGDGLDVTLMSEQSVPAGIRWQTDRMFMLTDSGFWDIPPLGPARWYPTSTVLVLGIRAGDVDGDGDQDMMLLTTELSLAGADPTTGSPLVSRLAVWERTPDGLHERAEVTRGPGMLLPMPFVFGDVDGDQALDVISFEHGAPVGYLNDGSFGFTRTLLGATATDYETKLVALVDYADRNDDDIPDLVVIAGEALEVDGFVLLGDGTGMLGEPGPAVEAIAALVPHGATGMGFGIEDVTGDGLADILIQDPQGTDAAPILRLYVSADATRFEPAVELTALGFELADVDEDGKTDIVSTLHDRAIALLSRPNAAFETRELGVDMSMPRVRDFVVDPGAGTASAVLHVLYAVPSCPTCDAGCAGRCIFDTCQACLSDADCRTGRCTGQACMP
jgi:hypothetical protein